jgi:hypothetical protein
MIWTKKNGAKISMDPAQGKWRQNIINGSGQKKVAPKQQEA